MKNNFADLESLMETTNNNEIVEKELAEEEAKIIADAQKKIEKTRESRRAQIAKKVQEREAAALTKAQKKAKAQEIVEKSGCKSVNELLKAVLPLVSPMSLKKIMNPAAVKKVKASSRRGPGNGLTKEERINILKMKNSGVSPAEIAKKYGIAVNTVYNVKNKLSAEELKLAEKS